MDKNFSNMKHAQVFTVLHSAHTQLWSANCFAKSQSFVVQVILKFFVKWTYLF